MENPHTNYEDEKQHGLRSTCKYLAKLAIPNKFPKYLLTWFSNPSSDYLPNEDQVVEFVKKPRYVVEVGIGWN